MLYGGPVCDLNCGVPRNPMCAHLPQIQSWLFLQQAVNHKGLFLGTTVSRLLARKTGFRLGLANGWHREESGGRKTADATILLLSFCSRPGLPPGGCTSAAAPAPMDPEGWLCLLGSGSTRPSLSPALGAAISCFLLLLNPRGASPSPIWSNSSSACAF